MRSATTKNLIILTLQSSLPAGCRGGHPAETEKFARIIYLTLIMSVRRAIPEKDGLYFITITCAQWLHLFEITQSYNIVYNWFDHLKTKGHLVCGYVVMPNHLHALIAFRNTGQSINTIIGNGKRFMAYELIERLKANKEISILNALASLVNDTDKTKGQHHAAFEPSFDWKECIGKSFILQKLNYIHENPCRGAWRLAASPHDYEHSSAKFYSLHMQGREAETLRRRNRFELCVSKAQVSHAQSKHTTLAPVSAPGTASFC
jgi:REP element-mobilizing transposase RayT